MSQDKKVSLLNFADRENKYCLKVIEVYSNISQVILPCLMPCPLKDAASNNFSTQMGFPLHSQLQVETDIKSVALFKEKNPTLIDFLIHRVTFKLMLCRITILCFSFRERDKESAFSYPSSCQEYFIFSSSKYFLCLFPALFLSPDTLQLKGNCCNGQNFLGSVSQRHFGIKNKKMLLKQKEKTNLQSFLLYLNGCNLLWSSQHLLMVLYLSQDHRIIKVGKDL